MSMSTAISELKVRRDIYLNNAEVAARENERLIMEVADIDAAIKVLEAYDSAGKSTTYGSECELRSSGWGAGSVDD